MDIDQPGNITCITGGTEQNQRLRQRRRPEITRRKVQKRTITEVVNAAERFTRRSSEDQSRHQRQITELNVQEGDSVKKGQVLARIYADIYNIQRNGPPAAKRRPSAGSRSGGRHRSVESATDQAQRTYDMQKKLFDDKVISRNEFNIAEANLRSAQANYNAAKQGIRSGQATVQSARANLEKANKDLEPHRRNGYDGRRGEPAQCKTRRTRGGKQPHERYQKCSASPIRSKIEVRWM